jgi:hypothetical protein
MVEHLLLSKLNMFNDLHLLDVARKGKLKLFLSTEPVKEYLNDLWRNGYYSYSSFRIKPLSAIKTLCYNLFTLGLIAPFYAFERKKVDEDVKTLFFNKQKLSLSPKTFVRLNQEQENVTYFGKLIRFHSRPATRFFYDNVSLYI